MMAADKDTTLLVNSSLDEWASENAQLSYMWDVMGQAGDLSLDVARSVIESYRKLMLNTKCSGRRRQIGGFIQCQKCNTPWIAGFCQSRLLGFPRSARNIKNLLKKKQSHPSKLSKVERTKLSSFHSRQNMIEITCLICKHKMRELFPGPVKEKILVKTKPVVTKRKKKVKEVNAGLYLSHEKTQNNTSNISRSSPFCKEYVTSTQEISAHSSEDSVKLRNEVVFDTFMESQCGDNESVCTVRNPEKTSSKRATKPIATLYHSESSLVNSLSKSATKSTPGSKSKRFHDKDVKGLKKAALKDINRHKTEKISTLSDFLNSL